MTSSFVVKTDCIHTSSVVVCRICCLSK